MSFGKSNAKPFGRRANVSDEAEPVIEKPSTASHPPVPPAAISGGTSSFRSIMANLTLAVGSRTPVPVVEALRKAIELIKSDALALAAAVRSNARHEGGLPAELIYWPLRWKNCEQLFVHADAAGERQYTTFGFTPDFQKFNPLAQFELSRFYRLVLDTNMLAHGQLTFGLPESSLAELKSQIDGILVITTHFVEMLRSYPLTIDVMDGVLKDQAVIDAKHAMVRSQLAELSKLPMVLFDAAAAPKSIPVMEPSFIAAFDEPFQEGQIFMNGVHYKREYAELMRADFERWRSEKEAAGQTRH